MDAAARRGSVQCRRGGGQHLVELVVVGLQGDQVVGEGGGHLEQRCPDHLVLTAVVPVDGAAEVGEPRRQLGQGSGEVGPLDGGRERGCVPPQAGVHGGEAIEDVGSEGGNGREGGHGHGGRSFNIVG
jgi:hypothetical protein